MMSQTCPHFFFHSLVEHNDEPRVHCHFLPFSMSCRRWRWDPNSSSFCCVFSIRWRQQWRHLFPFSLVAKSNNKPPTSCRLFVFFPLVVDDDDQLRVRCRQFFFSTYRKWRKAPNSWSSSNTLFINSRRWRWINVCCHFFFVYVHLKKMMMSVSSLLSFLLFMHSEDDNKPSLSLFRVVFIVCRFHRKQWQANQACCCLRVLIDGLQTMIKWLGLSSSFCFVALLHKKMMN